VFDIYDKPMSGAPEDAVPEYDRFIVRFNGPPAGQASLLSDDELVTMKDAAEQALESLDILSVRELGSSGWQALKLNPSVFGNDKTMVANKVAELEAKGYTVEPDYKLTLSATPNDDRWSSISAAMSKISAPAAWDLTTGSSDADSPIVCVIDTGINFGHPDLAVNIHPSYGFNAITGQYGEAAANDDQSHGSHVSRSPARCRSACLCVLLLVHVGTAPPARFPACRPACLPAYLFACFHMLY
jgi:hypothetical protein